MKVLIGILLVVALTLIPATVAARCDLPCCCIDYCENLTFDYLVRYKDKVESGFFTPWGTPMYKSVWTSQVVEAHNAEEAATSLGLRQGYNCWVFKIF